jgi:hypothetical protein
MNSEYFEEKASRGNHEDCYDVSKELLLSEGFQDVLLISAVADKGFAFVTTR